MADMKYMEGSTGSVPKKEKVKGSLTPDIIAGKLFSFHDKAHFFHLQTTGFAQHKMLDELYTELVGMKDEICEYLLGVQAPKRFPTITLTQVQPYSDDNVTKMLDEGFQFSIKLCEYAESKNLEQLCNLSSELQGLIIKCKYLNTLK